MNRLLVRGEPVGPFQHVYVFQGDKLVDKLGIGIDDLNDVVFSLAKKYNINHIDLSGSRVYMMGIEEQIKRAGIENYNINDLTFRYV